MTDAKPVVFTQVDTGDYDGIYEPVPLLVVGEIPAGGTSALEEDISDLQDAVAAIPEITPTAAPTIDATPALPSDSATDLQAVIDALVVAGVFTE